MLKTAVCAAILSFLLAVRFWPTLTVTFEQLVSRSSVSISFEPAGIFQRDWNKHRLINPLSGPTGLGVQEVKFRLPYTPTDGFQIRFGQPGSEVRLVSFELPNAMSKSKWTALEWSSLDKEQIRAALTRARSGHFQFVALLFLLCSAFFAGFFYLSAKVSASEELRLSLWQERGVVTFITLALLAALFRNFIFGDKLYLYADTGMDTYGQYFPILAHWADRWERYHQLFWPYWTFKLAGGTNLGPQLLDPFNVAAILFGKAVLPFTLAPLAVIKYTLLALAAHAYLTFKVESSAGRIAGALWITFCGFSILWGQHYFYLTYALYVLLLLTGVERYERGLGAGLLILSGALLGALSVTLLLSVLIFVAVQTGLNRKLLRTNAVLFLGVGLTAWASVPSAFRLFADHPPRPPLPRWGELFVSPPKEALTTLARFFSLDLLGTGNEFIGAANYFEAATVSCGVLCILCFVSSFTLARTQRIPLLIYIAAMFSPLARLLLSGGVRTEYRELSFFLVILLVVAAARNFARLAGGEIRGRSWVMFGGLLSAVIGVAAVAAILDRVRVDDRPGVAMEIAAFAFLYLVALFTSGRLPSSSRRLKELLMLTLVACEAFVFADRAINERALVSKQIFSSPSGYTDDTNTALMSLPDSGQGFRVAKLYRSVWYNDSLYQNFNSVEGYFSFLNSNYRSFLKQRGVPLLLNERVIRTEDFPREVLDYLGVKYFLTTSSSAQPVQTKEIGRFGAVRIFENIQAGPMIRVEPAGTAEVKVWQEDHIEFDVRLEHQGNAIATIPFDAGWSASVDGVSEKLTIVEGGLTGLRLDEGAHHIVLSYRPSGFSLGIFLSICSLVYCLAAGVRRVRNS